MPGLMISIYTQNKQCHIAESLILVLLSAWHNIPAGALNSGIFLDISSMIKLCSLYVSWKILLLFTAGTSTVLASHMVWRCFGGPQLGVGCGGVS